MIYGKTCFIVLFDSSGCYHPMTLPTIPLSSKYPFRSVRMTSWTFKHWIILFNSFFLDCWQMMNRLRDLVDCSKAQFVSDPSFADYLLMLHWFWTMFKKCHDYKKWWRSWLLLKEMNHPLYLCQMTSIKFIFFKVITVPHTAVDFIK